MIFPKIRLAKKKRFPALWVFNNMVYPHQALIFMWKTKAWKILEDDGKMVKVQSRGVRLKLTYYHAAVMFGEWENWEKFYLPLFSLHRKTVMDVGSGCGETVFFYLKQGASKVIAVEPNTTAISFLKENCKINRWNVEVIPKTFSLDLFKIPFDYIKMDCEGCEEQLLHLQSIDFQCVIEVHSKSLMESIVRKFSMKLVSHHHPENDVYLVRKDI
jgi:tRNA G37 N-methylase Trm5